MAPTDPNLYIWLACSAAVHLGAFIAYVYIICRDDLYSIWFDTRKQRVFLCITNFLLFFCWWLHLFVSPHPMLAWVLKLLFVITTAWWLSEVGYLSLIILVQRFQYLHQRLAVYIEHYLFTLYLGAGLVSLAVHLLPCAGLVVTNSDLPSAVFVLVLSSVTLYGSVEYSASGLLTELFSNGVLLGFVYYYSFTPMGLLLHFQFCLVTLLLPLLLSYPWEPTRTAFASYDHPKQWVALLISQNASWDAINVIRVLENVRLFGFIFSNTYVHNWLRQKSNVMTISQTPSLWSASLRDLKRSDSMKRRYQVLTELSTNLQQHLEKTY